MPLNMVSVFTNYRQVAGYKNRHFVIFFFLFFFFFVCVFVNRQTLPESEVLKY